MATAMTPYPVQVGFEADTHIRRWRPLVQWVLAIPQLLVSSALRSVRGVLALVSFFTVLFTCQIPRSLFDFMAMTYRYEWRVTTYTSFLRENYPPFDFTPVADDAAVPVRDPATFSIEYPTRLNRWLPLVKWFLAIPHLFVLVGLFIGAVFAGLAAFFAVIFTGRYPEGVRDYLVGVSRWSLRVQAYIGLMTDAYPPFSLQP